MTVHPPTYRPSVRGTRTFDPYTLRITPSSSHTYHVSLPTYITSRTSRPAARVYYRRARSTLLSEQIYHPNTAETRNVRFAYQATVETAVVKRVRKSALKSTTQEAAARRARINVSFAGVPEQEPRDREAFRRRSRLYVRGKYADRSGRGFVDPHEEYREEDVEIPESEEDEEMEDDEEDEEFGHLDNTEIDDHKKMLLERLALFPKDLQK